MSFNPPKKPVLYYDGDCSLCRSLARWVEVKSQIQVEAGTNLESILIIEDNQSLTGEKAWSYLLKNIPALASLNWLASSLGLSKPAAKGLEISASWAKRFCRNCN